MYLVGLDQTIMGEKEGGGSQCQFLKISTGFNVWPANSCGGIKIYFLLDILAVIKYCFWQGLIFSPALCRIMTKTTEWNWRQIGGDMRNGPRKKYPNPSWYRFGSTGSNNFGKLLSSLSLPVKTEHLTVCRIKLAGRKGVSLTRRGWEIRYFKWTFGRIFPRRTTRWDKGRVILSSLSWGCWAHLARGTC